MTIGAFLKQPLWSLVCACCLTLLFSPMLFVPMRFVLIPFEIAQMQRPLVLDLHKRHIQLPKHQKKPEFVRAIPAETCAELPVPVVQKPRQKVVEKKTSHNKKPRKDVALCQVPTGEDHVQGAPIMPEAATPPVDQHKQAEVAVCGDDKQLLLHDAVSSCPYVSESMHNMNGVAHGHSDELRTDIPKAAQRRWFRDQHVEQNVSGEKTHEDSLYRRMQTCSVARSDQVRMMGHPYYKKEQVALTSKGLAQYGALSQDLSVLPCTMISACHAEVEIFAAKVHHALGRYLDEHNFYVYSPRDVQTQIGFDLIVQGGGIIAYVVTRTSSNTEFDAALGEVIRQIGNDLLAPHADQPTAFPFMFTVYFGKGLQRYHMMDSSFARQG